MDCLSIRNASSVSVLSCNNLSNTNNSIQRKLVREVLTPLNTQRLDRRHVITKSDIVGLLLTRFVNRINI